MAGLGTTVLGVRLPFVAMNAPGTPSDASGLRRLATAGSGALCLRTVTVHPFVHPEFRSLHNPGHDKLVPLTRELAALDGPPVIASVAGGTADEYAFLARTFAEAGASLVEMNLTDPWVSQALSPYDDTVVLGEVASKTTDACPVPVLARLPDHGARPWDTFVAVLRESGVRGVTVANDFSGLEKFVLAARGTFDVVAVGGVASGFDVHRTLAKGAKAVQIDEPLRREGRGVFGRLAREMEHQPR